MGLYRVLGGNLSFIAAFKFVRPKLTLVIFVNLLIGLAATGLSHLSILLGFLLSLLALFVPMLVVEKKLPVGRAFHVSMVSLFRQLFSILLLFLPLVLIAAIVLSILLLVAQAVPVLVPVIAFFGGAILINLLAWLYLLKGALYRDLFGVRVASVSGNNGVMGSFSA